jgi:uncharacterized protein YbdZ (MbtH family)
MSAKKLSTVDEFVVDESETDNDAPEAGQAPQQEQAQAPKQALPANGKSNQPFDPTQYLSKFDGRDYLEVKWRLLWMRSQHPDARITTEIVQHNEENGFALFRAEVEVPGGGKATGWGSETVRDFHDYIEAAETKALGRALAALGYGTQFCSDFDFSANARPGKNQVVDAPVNIAEPRTIVNRASSFIRNEGGNGNGKGATQSGFSGGGFNNRPAVQSVPGGRIAAEEDDFDQLPAAGGGSPNGSGATEKQIKAIYAIGRASKRLSESQVDDRSVEVFGLTPAELTKAEASQFIDMLKGEAAA